MVNALVLDKLEMATPVLLHATLGAGAAADMGGATAVLKLTAKDPETSEMLHIGKTTRVPKEVGARAHRGIMPIVPVEPEKLHIVVQADCAPMRKVVALTTPHAKAP